MAKKSTGSLKFSEGVPMYSKRRVQFTAPSVTDVVRLQVVFPTEDPTEVEVADLDTSHLPRKKLVRKLLNARKELDEAVGIAKEVDKDTLTVIEEIRYKIKCEILKICGSD